MMCVAMGCGGASQWVTPIVMNIQGFALSRFFRQIFQQPHRQKIIDSRVSDDCYKLSAID